MHCEYYEAGRCRSCSWLPLPLPEQLTRKVRTAAALLPEPSQGWLPPVPSPQTRFRNKAKLAVGGTLADPHFGIPAIDGEPGVVTDLSACPLHVPAIEAALAPLRSFVTTAALVPYNVATRRGELKHLLITANPRGELMVRFVLRSREAETRLRKHLPTLLTSLPNLAVVSLNLLPAHAALTEGEQEVLLHGHTLTMPVAGVELHLRPGSFFQTNTPVAEALYRQATKWLQAVVPQRLWDLYCGVGGFALAAAHAMPQLAVTGVEVSEPAVASAQRTARHLGLGRAHFRAGDATAFALSGTAPVPDAAVVNPPRRGIGPVLADWLERSGVQTLLYSSCNPRTLATDLAAMPSLRLVRAQLLDMFPNTAHAEVLVLLQRS